MSKNYVRIGLATLVLLALASSPALAQVTMFGSLSNFDAINDTGQVCHGFEIELEGIHPGDIAFTFGAPYIRYGDPSLVDTGLGTIVRYASSFSGGNWAAGTPAQDPLNPIITGGHQLFFQGDPNYLNEPGDHFGVAFNGNPTKTVYRWLLGDASGNLMPSGSTVKIPAPVFNVQPPANPAAPAAIQAIVPALPIENPGDLFGEAIWAKVFVIESPHLVELDHLLVGDPEMPDGSEPAEIEIEWQLLQEGKGGGQDELDSGLNDLAVDSESITRRYEFYAYTGPYDPENHEALIEDAVANPDAVGAFLGGQNAAVNLQPFNIPEPSSLALLAIGLAAMFGYYRHRHGGRS